MVVRPKNLLIYYGYPSLINGSNGDVDQAAEHFRRYRYIVLGANLEKSRTVGTWLSGDPSIRDEHPEHQNTRNIIQHRRLRTQHFYGYVDMQEALRSVPDWHTYFSESFEFLSTRIDAWLGMGVSGIFLDNFGFDFRITRELQNRAVNYIHEQRIVSTNIARRYGRQHGYPVIVNAWDPDDVFDAVAGQDSEVGSRSNIKDHYLSESYLIKSGEPSGYQPIQEWSRKSTKLENYRNLGLNFDIFSVTTIDKNFQFNLSSFNYAWYGAMLYQHEAFAWGEVDFGAENSLSSYKPRPSHWWIVWALSYVNGVQNPSQSNCGNTYIQQLGFPGVPTGALRPKIFIETHYHTGGLSWPWWGSSVPCEP